MTKLDFYNFESKYWYRLTTSNEKLGLVLIQKNTALSKCFLKKSKTFLKWFFMIKSVLESY